MDQEYILEWALRLELTAIRKQYLRGWGYEAIRQLISGVFDVSPNPSLLTPNGIYAPHPSPLTVFITLAP